MMKIFFSISLLFALSLTALAQEKSYADVANERAEKIVSPLKIADAKKANRVEALVANQYIGLSKLQTKGEEAAKENPGQKDLIHNTTVKEIAKLHQNYLAKLGKELSAEQIDKVKNGMTYHSVPKTYANYLLMLPYLSKVNKYEILKMLIEAREFAMQTGTAKEKHAWFNKYKGKIANMLSSQGYKLKDEGIAWAKRRDLKSDELAIEASNRIMLVLGLIDSVKHESVRNLVAYQYQQVEKIHAEKKARMDAAKTLTKEVIEKENQAAWEASVVKLNKQRDLFSSELLQFLDHDQAELVKNEMTGQGLKNEYEKFQALLPNLTDEQKKKVYDYLVEARDNAMNVLTSRERNQWFAKFRGRANNYLSAQGYNLRKATEDLEQKQQSGKP